MEYLRVEDIMKLLDIGESTAYKLIRQLNKELKEQGYIVHAGRLSKKYFYERTYGGPVRASR